MSALLVAFNAHRRRASYSKAPCRFNIIVNVSAPSTSDFTNDVWSPNIEGFFGRLVGIGGVDPGTFAGAFRLNGAKNLEPGAINGATNARNADFDASRCSAEYVTEASLQPSALQTLVCIKF